MTCLTEYWKDEQLHCEQNQRKSKSLRSSDYENTVLAEASEREDMDCFKPWKVQLAMFHFYFRTQLSVFNRLACVQPYKFVMQNKGIHVLNKTDWIICFSLLAIEALIKERRNLFHLTVYLYCVGETPEDLMVAICRSGINVLLWKEWGGSRAWEDLAFLQGTRNCGHWHLCPQL